MKRCRHAACGQPTGKRYAEYCDAHRWRHRGKPSTYTLTPEREAYLREHYRPAARGQAKAIAAALQLPRWRVSRWAAELGLTSGHGPGPRFTPQEHAFVLTHLGTRHVNWIAKQLGRSISSVIGHAKRHGLSQVGDHGYSARQVADGLGVSDKDVRRWIARGWLAASRHEQHGGPHLTYEIHPEALQRFIQQHPSAFRIGRVDQLWFLDLVFNGEIGEKVEAA